MNAMKTVELLRKYNKCQKCGSEKLGNGSGTLEVTDDVFKRTCKCGWVVVINEALEGDLSSPEIAEMHLDGTLCEQCGEYLGEAVGYPRLCVWCGD